MRRADDGVGGEIQVTRGVEANHGAVRGCLEQYRRDLGAVGCEEIAFNLATCSGELDAVAVSATATLTKSRCVWHVEGPGRGNGVDDLRGGEGNDTSAALAV